jgi:2-polyprenyl-3-methyl-5-hydroxy-6-metoxy-1,4-benzoquinol methylase
MANSFNYVLQEERLPLPPDVSSCAGSDFLPGEPPERKLLLTDGRAMATYASDTRDFDLGEVRRVKDGYGHLYRDRSATAALDDFKESIRRVAPDPFCDACDRASKCGRRFETVEAAAFRTEEAFNALWIRRLSGRVLDVGCGEQLYRDALQARMKSGDIEYHGLDPDERAIGRLREAIPDGHYEVGTIETYAKAPGYFDHILCLRSLNHFTDVVEAFGRMASLLRPMGTLFMVECTTFALLRERRQVEFADGHSEAGHQHFRNWESWEALPYLRLFPFRTLYHRPVSSRTNNQWVLHLLREPSTLPPLPGGCR